MYGLFHVGPDYQSRNISRESPFLQEEAHSLTRLRRYAFQAGNVDRPLLRPSMLQRVPQFMKQTQEVLERQLQGLARHPGHAARDRGSGRNPPLGKCHAVSHRLCIVLPEPARRASELDPDAGELHIRQAQVDEPDIGSGELNCQKTPAIDAIMCRAISKASSTERRRDFDTANPLLKGIRYVSVKVCRRSYVSAEGLHIPHGRLVILPEYLLEFRV